MHNRIFFGLMAVTHAPLWHVSFLLQRIDNNADSLLQKGQSVTVLVVAAELIPASWTGDFLASKVSEVVQNRTRVPTRLGPVGPALQGDA